MQRLLIALYVLLFPTAVLAANAGNMPPPDNAAIVYENTAFASDLYNKLSGQKGNLFFSPFSISSALAMTYAGARGQTATDMAKVLDFTLPPDRLHPAMAKLVGGMDTGSADADHQLAIANSIWISSDQKVLPDYIFLIEKNYKAGINTIDFAANVEKARQTINNWVADHTAQKIQDLIPSGILHEDTKMVLTNAIYFKNKWQAPFDKNQVSNGDFNTDSTQKVSTPFMHRLGGYKFAHIDTFKMLQLPYQNDNQSMVVILPDTAGDLAALEKSLTVGHIQQWVSALTDSPNVQVSLPKFKMTEQFFLSKALIDMGMGIAFGGQADFSGMTGKKDLLIGEVIHKAFVVVDEDGTEASAATAVLMGPAGMAPQISAEFKADHPFIFLILDNRTNSILFMGRVNDPSH